MALELAEGIIEYLPDEFFTTDEAEDYFGIRAALGDFGLGKHNSSDEPLEVVQEGRGGD